MIDETKADGRIIASAMRLAGEKPWRDVGLAEIASGAGLTLVDMKQHFASKSEILQAFSRQIDDEMLRAAPPPTSGQSTRDALFEVIMARFDALAPYRTALRSIVGEGLPDPLMLRQLLASQHWMLQAAGVDTDGPAGAVRIAGLMSVYAQVFRTWLDDEDPGFARTMAALDRRLRSGERSLQALDDIAGIGDRLIRILARGPRGFARRPGERDAGAPFGSGVPGDDGGQPYPGAPGTQPAPPPGPRQ